MEPDKGTQPSDGAGPAGMSRRLTTVLLGTSLLATLTGFAGTALAYLSPRKESGGAGGTLTARSGILKAGDVADGQGTVARSSRGKILVVRRGEELLGLEATCTHLGCTVTWNGDSEEVECPCHGARYDIRGNVLRGPAREPLQVVTLRISENGIELAPATT